MVKIIFETGQNYLSKLAGGQISRVDSLIMKLREYPKAHPEGGI
jgi:hypothetical protein